MSDAPVVHIGENSPEYVAYLLMLKILHAEGERITREAYLSTYAQCVAVVRSGVFRASR